MAETMIKAVGVKKHFDSLEVLKGIDLELNKNEVMAIIGPSGSGKSTFLRCLNKLETVFISFNEEIDNEVIQYTDGKKISNSAFKKLTEKIRECSLVQDKIKLIKNNIKSLEDLTDMLEAECLFEDEYVVYFKSLSQMEIILLYKYISDLNLESEYENEWCLKFNNYISSLREEEQVTIQKYKEIIQLI